MTFPSMLRRPPLRFTHDFKADLAALVKRIYDGPPVAFTKFADGERLLIDGVPHQLRKAFEEWDSGDAPIASRINDALEADLPGYHVGISCPCCSDSSGYKHGVADWEFYRSRVTMDLDRITFANIFVNSNYPKWLDAVRGMRTTLVSSSAMSLPEFRVPKNAVNTDWDIDGLVTRLGDEKHVRPIFVAAGPTGCVIVHEYWKRYGNRTIIDVGSTLDPFIHKAATRGYHDPQSPNRNKTCEWDLKAT